MKHLNCLAVLLPFAGAVDLIPNQTLSDASTNNTVDASHFSVIDWQPTIEEFYSKINSIETAVKSNHLIFAKQPNEFQKCSPTDYLVENDCKPCMGNTVPSLDKRSCVPCADNEAAIGGLCINCFEKGIGVGACIDCFPEGIKGKDGACEWCTGGKMPRRNNTCSGCIPGFVPIADNKCKRVCPEAPLVVLGNKMLSVPTTQNGERKVVQVKVTESLNLAGKRYCARGQLQVELNYHSECATVDVKVNLASGGKVSCVAVDVPYTLTKTHLMIAGDTLEKNCKAFVGSEINMMVSKRLQKTFLTGRIGSRSVTATEDLC